MCVSDAGYIYGVIDKTAWKFNGILSYCFLKILEGIGIVEFNVPLDTL